MQADVNNVLSDLKTHSDSADQIIADTNLGTEQVNQWFSLIRETAVAIVSGTYCSGNASTSSEKSLNFSTQDLPSLVNLIKGKQNSHVSPLLAEVVKDNRARLSHRKSRKSLRKIVLGRSRSNQWKISNRKSSVSNAEVIEEVEDKKVTPLPKDRLMEYQVKSAFDISANKSQHNSYFPELNKSCKNTPKVEFTPILKKTNFSSNDNLSTPFTRSKLKTVVKSPTAVKKSISFSSEISYFSIESDPETPDNNNTDCKIITIDSDSSSGKSSYVTPVTQYKRKSAVQLTQDNAKKIKSTTSEIDSGKQNKNKQEDNLIGNNAFKKIKLAKDITAVIPTKNIPQPSQTGPNKRILKEIQKKEKVSQNAKKLLSLKKTKIEESKKAREKKMEKAMQQRLKIEKEKEDKIRSRTQSKQENLQQTEPVPKKGAIKKVESIFKTPEEPSPIKKNKVSPDEQKSLKDEEVNKTYLCDPSPKEIADTKAANNLNATYVHSHVEVEKSSASLTTTEKAPPKPTRNAKKAKAESSVKKKDPLPSTPTNKKIDSKINAAKMPTLNNAKKSNSYAVTLQENSFVSYDISEIRSDDSDEEESNHQKPIPAWASGVNLRTALLKQHYTPIDVNELFGNCFPTPELADIMGIEKKHYKKRTSSAIWLESPNRSRSYYT